MPDYLHALLGRTVDAEPVIRPRVPSLFEPVRPAVGDVSSLSLWDRSATAETPTPPHGAAAVEPATSSGSQPAVATPRLHAATSSHPVEGGDRSPAETGTDAARQEVLSASDADPIDRSAGRRGVEASIIQTAIEPPVPQRPALTPDRRVGRAAYTSPSDARGSWPDPATRTRERPHEAGLPWSAADLRLRLATLERAIASVGGADLEARDVSVRVQAAEQPRESPVAPIGRSGAPAPLPAATPAFLAGVRSSPSERIWHPSPPRRLVQVSIGRLEIRVDREPQAARRVPDQAVTATSLTDYLNRRNGAGR